MKPTWRTGAVYVEFLVIFWPLMLLWLGLTHIGILYGVHIVVNHAAAKAARAAIVILPDEDDRYEGDEPLTILQDADSNHANGLEAYAKAKRGGRLDTIRKAARLPLAAVSPRLALSMDNPLANFVAGWLWTEYAVAVTFPDEDGNFLTEFNPTGPLTARVTYLYKCPVPLISRLLCHKFSTTKERFVNSPLRESDHSSNTGIDAQAVDILDTVNASVLGGNGMRLNVPFALRNNRRFLALEAARTLPMQGQRK